MRGLFSAVIVLALVPALARATPPAQRAPTHAATAPARDELADYEDTFRAAGWTIVAKGPGSLLAHYTQHGHDVWAHVHGDGHGHCDVVVADTGNGKLATLQTWAERAETIKKWLAGHGIAG